jgi:hypothetical protein
VITKGERAELRSLIRQRFKVLRADVTARESELNAELEDKLKEHFAADDKAWSDVAFLIDEAVQEANRKANDIVRKQVGQDGWPHDGRIVRSCSLSEIRNSVVGAKPYEQERMVMRRQGQARITATVKSALLKLDRTEADLLTRLVAGALESEEARSFLGEIPTVSALVPADRLLELERSLRDDADDVG